MVELEVHLGQRLLHVLNMRGRILEQTLALTYVGAQLDEMTFGAKAGAADRENEAAAATVHR